MSTWDISAIDAPQNSNGYRYPIKKVYQVQPETSTGTPQFADSNFTTIPSGEYNSIHHVLIKNEGGSDRAYISYYTKGIRVLNVANPLSPTELAYYDTPGVSGYVFPVYNGPWGVYPYFASGTILASAPDGLYVFRPVGVFAGTISVNTLWTNQISVIGNVTIPAGVTVTTSGATVMLNPGTTVTVEGTLSLDFGTTITGGGSIVKSGSGKILSTNNATALAANNSPKLARDATGNYHLVFETEGEVCYEKLTGSGAITEFRRLSNGVADGAKTNPCLYARDRNSSVLKSY